MKVSIIIPIYNVQDYIINCLDSISRQTYQDIECLLVDDCGSDNSVYLAENYIKHYTGNIHFIILHNNKNLGLSGARNTGIKAATGEYIFFLDSDDMITYDCIDSLLHLANKYPFADFIQGNILGEDGKPSPHAFNNTIPEFCDDKIQLEDLMLHCVITSAWNRLIKRSLIVEYQLFFPEGLLHEDMFWIYNLSKYVTAAAFTTKGTYIYTIHEGSIMTSISNNMRIKRLSSRLKASEYYYQDIKMSFSSSQSRRSFFGINLFSCIQELVLLHSFKQWTRFWFYVYKIALHNLSKITIPRILFFLILLPPSCFFVRKEKLRWRIQHNVISKI